MSLGMQQMLDDIRVEYRYFENMLGKSAINERVMVAMSNVPREQFIPETWRRLAFVNGPVSIGEGQTISQPFMVALMTDLLEPQPSHVVLEIGTGSGYQTSVLAELVAHVCTIEIIPALAQVAQQRFTLMGRKNVSCKLGDGYRGWPENSPYDGIIVTAAATHIPPPLLDQLKPGGRLVIPVGEPYDYQELLLVEKNADGSVSSRALMGVSFVPLTGNLVSFDKK